MKRYRVSRPRNISKKARYSGTTSAAASRAPSRNMVPKALERSRATQQSSGRASELARTSPGRGKVVAGVQQPATEGLRRGRAPVRGRGALAERPAPWCAAVE